ncbi:MAG: retroviral-like aspartic protease family protein [Prevotella sp.]|nr:retroviral-like aspartic protease family protein [Prevotella sp.]
MKISKTLSVVLFSTIVIFSTCTKDKKPPVDLSKAKVSMNKDVVLPYQEVGNLKTIPVRLNGVNLDMIFDTGCSGMSMSLNELQTLAKNGKITESDVLGTTYSTIADGSIVEQGLINLREVQIGGEDGIFLKNVEASVVLNQQAPILLGNGVLDEAASVEVDNVKKTITFRRR